MKKLILFILFLIIQTIFAQAQTKFNKYSVSGKITTNIWTNEYFEGIEINTFSQSYLYSIGYYTGDDADSFGDEPFEEYNQLNLLIGKYFDSKNQKFRFQYQGGIGMFWGTIRTDEYDEENSSILTNAYFTEKISTIGFPLKIGGRYIPFKFFSIGIDLQANLNFEKLIFRPMLSLEIGKLRSSKKVR